MFPGSRGHVLVALGSASGRHSLGTPRLLAQRSWSRWPSLATPAMPWLRGTPHPLGALPITLASGPAEVRVSPRGEITPGVTQAAPQAWGAGHPKPPCGQGGPQHRAGLDGSRRPPGTRQFPAVTCGAGAGVAPWRLPPTAWPRPREGWRIPLDIAVPQAQVWGHTWPCRAAAPLPTVRPGLFSAP